MLSLARNGYTASQVDAALKSAARTIYFRYYLLDSSNNFLQILTNVTSGSVAYDTGAQIKRGAKFTLLDDGTVDFTNNRVQPWVYLKMPDGGFAMFPLGVFLLSTAPKQTDAALTVTRQVEGFDQLQILLDDAFTDTYVVSAGTNYISAVQSVILSSAFVQSQLNLSPTSATLPADMSWKPGTSKLEVINNLLQAINYRTLWFDEMGIAQALPYLTPAQRTPDYTYIDDALSVMYADGAQYAYDLFTVPNKWVLVVSEPDTTPLKSTYTNTNNVSPTSTTNRRRTIVKYIENMQAADQATLDALAQKQAFQDSQVYAQFTFNTAIMPMHSDYDVLNVTFSKLGVSGIFSEAAWSMDLVQGGKMKHVVQQVIQI